MKRVEFADLQHCILLRDKLVTNVVMRATEGFNLQCNIVARQVEERLPVLPDLYDITTTKQLVLLRFMNWNSNL